MSRQKTSIKDFIAKANSIHNNFYDYQLVDYVNTDTRIKIICPEPNHGIFMLTPYRHLKGGICPLCSGKLLNTFIFIERAKLYTVINTNMIM